MVPYLFVCMSVGLFLCSWVCLFICFSDCLLFCWSVGPFFFLYFCLYVCLFINLLFGWFVHFIKNIFDDTFHHLDRNPNVHFFAINPVQKTLMDWHLCESHQQNTHQFRLIWQLDQCIQNGVQLDQGLWFDLIVAHTFSNWIQHTCKDIHIECSKQFK